MAWGRRPPREADRELFPTAVHLTELVRFGQLRQIFVWDEGYLNPDRTVGHGPRNDGKQPENAFRVTVQAETLAVAVPPAALVPQEGEVALIVAEPGAQLPCVKLFRERRNGLKDIRLDAVGMAEKAGKMLEQETQTGQHRAEKLIHVAVETISVSSLTEGFEEFGKPHKGYLFLNPETRGVSEG